MKYEVWTRWLNYVGATVECDHIASFCSEARARHYVQTLNAEDDGDFIAVYDIYERTKAGKVKI